MNSFKIKVVSNFGEKPFGRYPAHGDYSGQEFRKRLLAPALRNHAHVTIDLTGYNRYGRSFIDEAFGGLVRDEGFTSEKLHSQLKIIHEELPSLVELVWARIDKAIKNK